MEGRVSYDVAVLLEYIRQNTRVPSVRAAMEEAREALLRKKSRNIGGTTSRSAAGGFGDRLRRRMKAGPVKSRPFGSQMLARIKTLCPGLPKNLVFYCGRHDFGTRVLKKTGNLKL